MRKNLYFSVFLRPAVLQIAQTRNIFLQNEIFLATFRKAFFIRTGVATILLSSKNKL